MTVYWKWRAHLIPCWPQPALNLGYFTIYFHGVSLAIGVGVGVVIFLKRANVLSLSKMTALRLSLLLIPIAFVGGHLMYCGFEDRNAIFKLEGITSFGAILACVPALAISVFRYRKYGWRWFDAASYSAVGAALIARLGCFLAHDSIGTRTSFWLAVNCFDGPRYDLALLELIFLVVCATALFWAGRQNWHAPDGSTFALLAFSYGLFRFNLAQLREVPKRHYALTPEQLASVILLAIGVVSLWLIYKRGQNETPFRV